MGSLKSLAGQTAIYGVSSILGRLINYLLVPLHTAVFLPEALGVVTALYAYTAIFMIIYTYGMETTFFRFVKESPQKAYNSSFSIVIIISTLLSVLIFGFSSELSRLIGYPNTDQYVRWIAIIMWIDAFLSIPFAKLRNENRARKFASIKVINIILNISLQYSFLQILPQFITDFKVSIGSIFLANLIANASIIVFLFPEVRQLRFGFNKKILKPILLYATPIFLMGLAGMFNEQLDKILLEHLLPDNYYENMDSTAALGVYGQTFKIGIFMMLAIQAFRYAGEPFFFSKAADRNAPELFAKIMHYFSLSALLLFVLVSINVNLIAQIFLRNPEYRVALYLVPLLLFGKLIYGIYLNLSIWFKLTDKTQFGLYFGLAGVVITILGNVFLIPVIGMVGCAVSMIACYTAMSILCYFYGQRYFPIPYNFFKLIPYTILSVLIVYLSFQFQHQDFLIDSVIKIIISIAIIVGLWWTEKNKLIVKSS